jgi:hypothetical protein
VTGRRLPNRVLSASMILPVARATSAVQRFVPFHLPIEYEGVLICSYDSRLDDSRARSELGISPRPLTETYADTVRWLYATGRLTAAQAGAVARADVRRRSPRSTVDQ